MITEEQKKLILNNMVDLLEIPESAYEKANKRYEDLGEWFGRNESSVENNDPHVFPQGSFRLGTAIRPINGDEAYDLDLCCKLREGITKYSHTQQNLKDLVGQELENYRIARGIKATMEEKHRCWRLEYQDDLSFYMDIVPCIPVDETKRIAIQQSMKRAGTSEFIANSASQLTVSIADDRHTKYKQICEDWNISNPQGYAKWFESRMTEDQQVILMQKAQVDDVPLFKRKSPLQRSIQLLKRHRDQMFQSYEDIKPISIIITTLATRAYNGESDIYSALTSILSKMGNFVNSQPPRVPNPVDPAEDFADRWAMPKYRDLNLEQNFWRWLNQVKSDFENITSTTDTKFIIEKAEQRFSVRFNISELSKRLGLSQAAVSIVTPSKSYSIKEPAKPWAE
jgi:hypothetical protein